MRSGSARCSWSDGEAGAEALVARVSAKNFATEGTASTASSATVLSPVPRGQPHNGWQPGPSLLIRANRVSDQAKTGYHIQSNHISGAEIQWTT